jgi:hypothetical protein
MLGRVWRRLWEVGVKENSLTSVETGRRVISGLVNGLPVNAVLSSRFCARPWGSRD